MAQKSKDFLTEITASRPGVQKLLAKTGASLRCGGSKQDYGTPDDFLAAVEKKFGERIGFDLAASDANSVVEGCYYDEEDDSLAQDWNKACDGGILWLNPPYSNIAPWVKKASQSHHARTLVLVPASVGSNWWRDYVHGWAEIHFLNGRLTFKGCTQPYPKDCALLQYGQGAALLQYHVWDWKKTLYGPDAGLVNT